LVYDESSLFVDATRDAVRSVLNELGLALDWEEWDRQRWGRRDAERHFGPSNVLVNGEPVAEANQTPAIWNDGRGPVLVRAALLKALAT
jgi:hypothetical protein